MTLMMILLAASALGSHSRGGFLALGAMAVVLWWRSPGKVLGAFVMVVAGLSLIAFMPEHWTERMATIQTYKDDQSALGRFSAWWVSWRVALEYPFGVGFNLARPELFARYSPYPDLGTPVAHSIYFQVLGHHGFVGLFLFLLIWVSTWFTAARVRREAAGIPQARWCVDLAGMCQVSLAGYLVGGAFLNLSYFDLPYNLMVLVVLTHQWVRRRAWETEPLGAKSRWSIPGLHAAPAAR
jgi:probable O-glycosylation ligase (exosortase A-associated)